MPNHSTAKKENLKIGVFNNVRELFENEPWTCFKNWRIQQRKKRVEII